MKNKGFTLVEILIVVGIILVLAVIGIPNLLRSRTNALEATAVSALRTLNNACQVYLANNNTYPAVIGDLVVPVSNPPYIDTELGTGQKQNYQYIYLPTVSGFTINANPINKVGNPRYYFMDQTGIIRFNENGAAGANDPII